MFLAHPAFQDLGAYLEVPAISEDGAAEIVKLRELHARHV